MPRTLILGLGNDILTDDAIGLRLAQVLRASFSHSSDVDVRETTEMGLALLDHFAGYVQVWLLDAIQTGQAEPGFLHELDAAGLKQLAGGSPHFLGVGETLALGRQLGLEMPRQVGILAVEVEDPYTLGTRMTPALETALPGLAHRIANRISGRHAGVRKSAPLAHPFKGEPEVE